ALHVVDTTPTGTVQSEDRDLRATVGLELSFGQSSVLAYGSGGVDRAGDARGVAGTMVLRWQEERLPSVMPIDDRIERVEIGAGLGSHSLVGIVMHLRAIERDPHVKAVVFAIDGAGGGMATIEEVRDEIVKVKKAGKRTYAYLVNANGRDYW